MSLRKRLRHLAMTWVFTRIRTRLRWTPSEGPPEGLSLDLLRDLCGERLGRPLVSVSHEHLSGWKRSGAYRVYLTTKAAPSWSVIFKNAHYTCEEIPAQASLPFSPGPPEYLVYGSSPGALAEYIPSLYRCEEVSAGCHYHYLMEDLAYGHVRALDGVRRDAALVVRLAGALPGLHRALRCWASSLGTDRLPRYGAAFSAALPAYVREKLGRYAERSRPSFPRGFLKGLAEMLDAYAGEAPAPEEELTPIHGDYHVANVFLPRRKSGLVLVDWEWTGLGRPHMDLASLLKLSAPEVEQEALSAYVAADGSPDLQDHRRRYEWCQLERGLLDAAFLSAQELEASHEARFSLRQTIETAVRRARRAYRVLAAG